MLPDTICSTYERCISILKHSKPFPYLFLHTGDLSSDFAPVQCFMYRIPLDGLQQNFMLLKILAPMLNYSQLAFDSSFMTAAGFWRYLRSKRLSH